ncbi:MAG TPA: pilus assembly protein TadG-related protein [Acidimicrobiales bacterium]|nr:pilus assembly protein TadG-related protein [Acidimicrobiales bacterium]
MTISHRRSTVEAARRGESGAVIVLVALTISVLVTATAFTVDLGRISTERRDLQKTADVTALDLSRRLDGRSAAEIVADPAWEAALDASLARNRFDAGAGSVTVAIGSWDPVTEVFTPSTGSQVPSAVRVELGSTVDYAFAPGSASPSRQAIAGQTASAGHQVGSFATRLDTGRSALLGALVGDALGVTVAGYDGLAGAQISLPVLLEELDLSLGDVDQLLAADVTVAELLRAEAEVLRRSGDLVRADTLDGLVLALPNPDQIIHLEDLLAIIPGGEAAAALADIDAQDLLNATALVANGTNLLDVPAADLTVGGQAVTVSTSVQVIEAPRWAFGPVGTTAATSQATITLELQVTIPDVSDSRITVKLQAASGEATSTAIGCRDPKTLDLAVWTGLLTTRADISTRLSLLGVPVADVVLHAAASAPPATTPVLFDLPPDAYGVPREAATPATSIGTASVVTDEVTLLGLPIAGGVAPLVDALTSTVLGPVLTQVETAVIQPLADALGLTVAGVDVAPLAITCSGPELVG